MRCTVCDGDTTVSKTNRRDNNRQVVRRRICKENPKHRFETSELPLGLSIDRVLVRRSGDRQLAEFNRLRLLRDVRQGVLKRMTEEEAREIVTKATYDLEMQLSAVVTPMSREERAEHPGYRVAITDATIRQAIENRLRQHGRQMPHVLYALSTLGRADIQNRSGFKDAEDVLRWIGRSENYPDLALSEIPRAQPVPTDEWWPIGDEPVPERVIKRGPIERRRFILDRFRTSIREAMLGRPDAHVTSDLVASWTLWGLAGQRDVLTAQLAVGVMECLRRVDDIAYLRWTAISKTIDSVGDFRAEALALLTHPSPHLMFSVASKPRPLPNRRELRAQ